MTLFSQSSGSRVETQAISLSTSFVEILDYPGSTANVESVSFCNKTGATVAVTLKKANASGDLVHYFYDTDVPANADGPLILKDHNPILKDGEKLMAKAASGSAIDVSVIYIQAR